MPVIPNQTRSVDPWSENRFSDNYNLRSRMLTGGRNAIVFLESFALSATDDHTISIGPGIAIKDDVMVHILEATSIDLLTNNGYMVSGEGEPPIPAPGIDFDLHILLHYHYNRSIPAPSARFVLCRYPEIHYTTANHLWLGRVFGTDNVITGINSLPIRIPDTISGTVFERHCVDPISGFTKVNGGVVRPATPGGSPVGWYEEWQYV